MSCMSVSCGLEKLVVSESCTYMMVVRSLPALLCSARRAATT